MERALQLFSCMYWCNPNVPINVAKRQNKTVKIPSFVVKVNNKNGYNSRFLRGLISKTKSSGWCHRCQRQNETVIPWSPRLRRRWRQTNKKGHGAYRTGTYTENSTKSVLSHDTKKDWGTRRRGKRNGCIMFRAVLIFDLCFQAEAEARERDHIHTPSFFAHGTKTQRWQRRGSPMVMVARRIDKKKNKTPQQKNNSAACARLRPQQAERKSMTPTKTRKKKDSRSGIIIPAETCRQCHSQPGMQRVS